VVINEEITEVVEDLAIGLLLLSDLVGHASFEVWPAFICLIYLTIALKYRKI
jgi:hypothetical protein